MVGQTGWLSPWHWIVIGLVALLFFGNRLPEVARSLGRAFKEFKRGLHDVSDEIVREPPPPGQPSGQLQPPEGKPEPRRTDQPGEGAPSGATEHERAPDRSDQAPSGS